MTPRGPDIHASLMCGIRPRGVALRDVWPDRCRCYRRSCTVCKGSLSCGSEVSQPLADIYVQLKQHRDFVPNLVETVKRYAA